MKHAYEFVQISAFTMNDQLFFYGISDATESVIGTLTWRILDWSGKELRKHSQSIQFPPLAAVKLTEPVSIDSFLRSGDLMM